MGNGLYDSVRHAVDDTILKWLSGAAALIFIILSAIQFRARLRRPLNLARSTLARVPVRFRLPIYLPRRRRTLAVESDGMRWVGTPGTYNYLTGQWRIRAECLEHDIELVDRAADGSIGQLGRVVIGIHDSPHTPYCVGGEHEVPYTESAGYNDARRKADLLLDREQRQRRG